MPALEEESLPDLDPFLEELEDAMSRGSAESCARALWHATDLLISGSYSEDHIWVFGEVISRLAKELELAARTRLSRLLCSADQAPVNVIYELAFDDSIEVAGPVLQHSHRIDDSALVENARTKSQKHLLAISKRDTIAEAVTDVLLMRGDLNVTRSVAANNGARFSDFGFLRMVHRSEHDSILAECLGTRTDIPRHVFQQLIAKASADVRSKLEAEHAGSTGRVQIAVADATGALHAKFGPASKDYFAAKKAVAALHRVGALDERQIREFAADHKSDEVTVALSLLCRLPADVVERALRNNNSELVLTLAKSLELSWATTTALLFLSSPNHRISRQTLDNLQVKFDRLNVGAARSVLTLYRSRKEASGESPRRLPQLHS